MGEPGQPPGHNSAFNRIAARGVFLRQFGMKLLFSSSDGDMVHRFTKYMKDTGISYEVREPYMVDHQTNVACYPELWILKNSDFQTATLLLGTRLRRCS